MRRLLFVLAALLYVTAAFGQSYLTPGTAPVTSVTGQTGAVPLPTICGNPTIPAGNTVANTAAETAFATTCTVPANSATGGLAIHLLFGGAYSAGTAQNARGRVHYTQTGTPAPATDPIIADTGSVGGLAAATNQEWLGDSRIMILSGGTAMDVQSGLTFQTGAGVTTTVPAGNVTAFSIDPTKPITFYLTVTWGAANTSNSMQLRTMVAK